MMASPVRLALVGTMGFLSLGAVAADESGHMVSSYLAAAIAEGLPKFESAQSLPNVPMKAVQGQPPAQEMPVSDIVRLPSYVVRESKPLDQEQVLVIDGRANVAMKRYLGDTNSLDRGILNHFTFPELWDKIPVLRYIPCPLGVTNQARALQRYEEDEKVSNLAEWTRLESLGRSPVDGIAKAVKQEIRYTLKACP